MRNLIILVILSGCANSVLTYDAEKIVETKKVDEQKCRFIGYYDGQMLSGVLNKRGQETARRKAKNQAAKDGVSHIEWVKSSSGEDVVQKVIGKGYICDESSAKN